MMFASNFLTGNIMADILLIFWGIGLIGVVFAIIAIIYFTISILSMLKSEIKSFLFFTLITGFIITINAIVIIFFGLIKLEITNILWYLVIFLFLMAEIVWGVDVKKLKEVVESTKSR